MFPLEKYIRKLAKQNRWQVIYSASKEINLNLFNNNSNYSYAQVLFLNYQ